MAAILERGPADEQRGKNLLQKSYEEKGKTPARRRDEEEIVGCQTIVGCRRGGDCWHVLVLTPRRGGDCWHRSARILLLTPRLAARRAATRGVRRRILADLFQEILAAVDGGCVSEAGGRVRRFCSSCVTTTQQEVLAAPSRGQVKIPRSEEILADDHRFISSLSQTRKIQKTSFEQTRP